MNAEVYLAAAEEHVPAAKGLYNSRRYVLCHYVAGLAVECLLRAYRYRRNPEFAARHDLYLLYHASGMARELSEAEVYVANALVSSVNYRWSNDHRYRRRTSAGTSSGSPPTAGSRATS